MLLDPRDPDAPKYWKYETSGVLQPVVRAYLAGDLLGPGAVRLMRMYLRQWIMSPVWAETDDYSALERLRRKVDLLQNRRQIDAWICEALELGIDPL